MGLAGDTQRRGHPIKKERIGLVVAVLLIVWLSAAPVRVENERYAMQAGMCWNDTLKLPDLACIAARLVRAGCDGTLRMGLGSKLGQADMA